MVDWGYFDKFETLTDKYLPAIGEGDTMATQTVTAICKLIYKWYNDGDVYDNNYELNGWANDLSSYANWLYKYVGAWFLEGIKTCMDGDDYEKILKKLADFFLDEEYLHKLSKEPKVGTVYECEGPFSFREIDDDEWW